MDQPRVRRGRLGHGWHSGRGGDASWIDLRDDCTDLAREQVVVSMGSKEYEVILDFSGAGRLLGVEVLGATTALDPALLRTLHRIDGPAETP